MTIELAWITKNKIIKIKKIKKVNETLDLFYQIMLVKYKSKISIQIWKAWYLILKKRTILLRLLKPNLQSTKKNLSCLKDTKLLMLPSPHLIILSIISIKEILFLNLISNLIINICLNPIKLNNLTLWKQNNLEKINKINWINKVIINYKMIACKLIL